MSPEEWLAAKSKKAPAEQATSQTQVMSPEEWMASKSGMPGPRAAAPEWAKKYPRLYETAVAARQIAGPTVEMLGAAGGGLAGTGAGVVGGPVGMAAGGVAGAGLGYGAAQELLTAADVALGLRQPRTGAQTVTEPLQNIATGATYEMGGQLAGKAVSKAAELAGKGIGKVSNVVGDITELPKQKAAALARAAAGEKLPEIQAALRNAPEGLTAAQAIAYQIDPVTGKAVVNAPAVQRMLKEAPRETVAGSQYFSDVARANEAAHKQMLNKLAGGTSQAESIATRQAEKEALNKLTTPMRETELAAANIAGQKLPSLTAEAERLGQAAGQKVEDVRRFTGAGGRAVDKYYKAAATAEGLTPTQNAEYMGSLAKKAEEVATKSANDSLTLGEAARFAKSAADSLEAHGLKPLESAPLVQRITGILGDPKSGVAGNDVMEAAVRNVADDIAKWTNKVGVIDANALEAIRKNSVDAAVAKMRPGLDQTAQKNLTASVLSGIKPAIDDAIEAAGGTGWRKYLETHAAGMNELNKTKFGAELMSLYNSSPEKFVQVVTNNSPETLRKIFGAQNYDLVKAMGEETAGRLTAAGRDIQRAEDIAFQATEGQRAFDLLLKDHFFKFQLPNMLNVATTTVNKVLDVLSGKIGKKSMDVLVEASKTAKSFDDLLKVLPASERSKFLKAIKDPSTFAQAGKTASKVTGAASLGAESATNALAPESQNQNALSR
jgi:hypothetical protein